MRRLNLPMDAFIATSHDRFRKPCTGMWEEAVAWLKERHSLKKDIDMTRSFYVGDAAGRLAGWQFGKKKDWSDSDRKFALNLDIRFLTPEEHFIGLGIPAPFDLGFDPKSLDPSNAQASTVRKYPGKLLLLEGSPGKSCGVRERPARNGALHRVSGKRQNHVRSQALAVLCAYQSRYTQVER